MWLLRCRKSISKHSITSSRPPAEGRDSRFVGEHDLDRLLHIEAFAVSIREDRPQVGGLFQPKVTVLKSPESYSVDSKKEPSHLSIAAPTAPSCQGP